MLFVSRKDPRTTETLPDTSLHNVRDCSASEAENRSCTSSRPSSFVPLANACLPKLTKEQFELHREVLRLGAALMSQNPDLFHQALTLLSAQHNLKVATPAASISDIIPFSRPHQRDQGDDASVAGSAAPRATFRKFVLPEEYAEKEYYQCMKCKEKRGANSFGAAHTHGASRPIIRWHCPICDHFLAVTHRGCHLKSCHADVVTVAQPQQQVAEPASSLKRARDADSDDSTRQAALYSPAEKVRPLMCDSSSTASAVPEESPDTQYSLFVPSPQASFSSLSEQSTEFANPIFPEADEEDPFRSPQQASLFSQDSEESFFGGAQTSPSTF